MDSSPSSSSSSSRSGSPDSRATTPVSLSSSPDCSSLQPTTYIYATAAALTPAALAALFDKHAADSCMGLVIDPRPSASCSSPPPELGTADWACAALDKCEYRLVKAHELPMDYSTPYVPTSPTHAAHLCLFARAGLRSVLAVPLRPPSDTGADTCTAYILERPPFVFATLADTMARSLLPGRAIGDGNGNGDTDVAQGNIPTLAEWDTLWAAWDAVTLGMIPPQMLHQKPIDLRHKCLFYIGHIPTFLDMLLSKAIGGAPTEPAWFWKIFERGIDPHVDDPDHCHNHSEVPKNDADWPSLADVLGFRNGVRGRLRALYADLVAGRRALSRNVARTLVMTYEHEAFHVETLLYMLIQKAGCGATIPPPGVATPPWAALAAQWAAAPPPAAHTVRLGPTDVVLGHLDSEANDFAPTPTGRADVPARAGHVFGWDNESPARAVRVGAFAAEWRCVTNGEYHAFWRALGAGAAAPKSWVVREGSVQVRTLFGLVPLAVAREWPVLAAYDELARYAAARGGRLPTEAELRLFLDTYDVGYAGGANVGMRNWHPVPGTMGLAEHGGRGSNGGVWEWTSTVFDTHEGLVPTQLFTGYSEDFFDGKHHVALGASYATLPRLERRTVRNFYQHNYPYPWIGARVVYDV